MPSSWLRRRPIRVAVLLLAVWVLNGFDLLFTILATRIGAFTELNPVAAIVLDSGNYAILAAYKISLVGLGSWILWHYRNVRFSEIGCWMMAMLYGGVALRWHRYYEIFNYYYYHYHYYYYYRREGYSTDEGESRESQPPASQA